MSQPLDELYFTWLYSQLVSIRFKNPSRTYWSLAKQLYTKEFIWLIPNDDNRLEDGRDLRYEFINSQEIDSVDPNWMGLGCSMLEMIMGLSRRLSFEAEGEPRGWFWHILENLDLAQGNDASYHDKYREQVDETCDRVIWRTYTRNGRGGLFPLRRAASDQRDVEIWYQLNAYILEND